MHFWEVGLHRSTRFWFLVYYIHCILDCDLIEVRGEILDRGIGGNAPSYVNDERGRAGFRVDGLAHYDTRRRIYHGRNPKDLRMDRGSYQWQEEYTSGRTP